MVKLDMRLPMALAYGVPDSDTPGWIGLLVMDVTDTRKRVYRCVATDGASYTWEPFASEGSGTGTGGGITVETDPTVPAWAKEPKKPTYTADEIGALPSSTKIPAKTSDLTNDSGFVADSQVYAKEETYSQTEVDGLIDALSKRLEAVADSDDVTLDQLSEIVAYIKSNKSLIDSITTSKVNVADIVNNLTTADAKKPLSAAQGKELKALYDSLPSWAKASNKPSYNKSEVGLGNVDNVRQYSASNPPPYPVKSVNGKTGAVTLGAADVGAATTEQLEQLSKDIADQQTAIDGKQPKGDYALFSELAAETTAREQAVADLNARLGQQTLLIAPFGEDEQEEAEAWLETDADKTKVYLMPDNTFWQYRQTTEVGGVTYKNLLPTATDTDRKTIYGEDYNGDGTADGYKDGVRLSSSGSVTTAAGNSTAGFITAQEEDILRIKDVTEGASNMYVIAYDSANTKTGYLTYGLFTGATLDANGYVYDETTGIVTVPLTSAKLGSGFDAIRISAGSFNNAIITINQEINENGGTVIVEKWASTGHTLTSSDFSAAIANLINITDTHTAEIKELKEVVESGNVGNLTDAEKIEKIKTWDKPVYDYSPVTLLSDDRVKSALTTEDRTISAIYAKYRALMAQYPRIITETNLGACTSSDTFSAVDILRFDIKEPDGLTTAAYNPDNLHETKPKIILMSGVHTEWVGVWGLYYAIEEIVTNPDFDDIRRNAHIIVVPCSNPFVLSNQTVDGWTTSHVNANGVAIHNNFGVDHRTSGSVGEYNYGGTAPYSELETQYIDKIMSDNPDAIAFVSCHNNDYSTEFGTPVIWASSAAYHMCNVVFRLIDKISKAWIDKYGETLTNAIDTIRADFPALQEGDYRLGRATMSSSAGTEQKNALKYGIQGVNVEISRMMKVFSGNTDGTSEVMTHGAEVYANLMRTVLAAYSYTDKEAYYK